MIIYRIRKGNRWFLGNSRWTDKEASGKLYRGIGMAKNALRCEEEYGHALREEDPLKLALEYGDMEIKAYEAVERPELSIPVSIAQKVTSRGEVIDNRYTYAFPDEKKKKKKG